MTLQEIIAAVERGETGNELDMHIANIVDGPHRDYTTSLDAALPGENIEHVNKVRFADGTQYWVAVHVGTQQREEAHAPTEIAARRAAWLRSMLG